MNHTKWLRELCEKRLQHRPRGKLFAEDYTEFAFRLFPAAAEILLEVLDYADTHPRRFPIETAPENTPVLVWLPGIQRPFFGLHKGTMWNSAGTGRMLVHTPTHWAPIPGEDE